VTPGVVHPSVVCHPYLFANGPAFVVNHEGHGMTLVYLTKYVRQRLVLLPCTLTLAGVGAARRCLRRWTSFFIYSTLALRACSVSGYDGTTGSYRESPAKLLDRLDRVV